jgi:SAM-dependent methyltransferase
MKHALQGYRAVWDQKPVLRTVYSDMFDRIAAACVEGVTLEVGGGVGNLKEKITSLVTSDIQFAPWLDLVADAQQLPFFPDMLSNIVLFDVLHHIEFPSRLFGEAARVLRPGGRIVMIEPAITFGSGLFYRMLHHEPVNMGIDPLAEGIPDPDRDPYDSNQAIPTLLATRDREAFEARFPGLRIAEARWFAFLAYPLSGGFKKWSLITEPFARTLLAFERKIELALGRHLGFRLLLVIEKKRSPGADA